VATTLDLTTFPTARNDATEDSWTKYAKGLITNGVLSGVANEFLVFGDSTGMQVKVKSGRAYIDGMCTDSTAQNTFAIAAADAINPRIDRIVLRLTTTSPATIACKVLTGTPSATPSPPLLLDDATHTDIPLAIVAVAALASTVTAGNVTDARFFATPPATSRIAQAVVNTSETTTSVLAADLTTFGPAVTVYVPPSGKVKLSMSASISPSAGQYGGVFWAAGGPANVITANSAEGISVNFGSGTGTVTGFNAFEITGLAEGPTTFLLQYSSSGGFSAGFAFRRIIVETYP
jgi:hypothetical protein